MANVAKRFKPIYPKQLPKKKRIKSNAKRFIDKETGKNVSRREAEYLTVFAREQKTREKKKVKEKFYSNPSEPDRTAFRLYATSKDSLIARIDLKIKEYGHQIFKIQIAWKYDKNAVNVNEFGVKSGDETGELPDYYSVSINGYKNYKERFQEILDFALRNYNIIPVRGSQHGDWYAQITLAGRSRKTA